MVQELEQNQQNQQTSNSVKPTKPTKPKARLIPQDDSSDSELSTDSDFDDDTTSPVEIKIKNKTYIMEGSNLFTILPNGIKGDFQGIYSNGKIKKTQPKDIDL